METTPIVRPKDFDYFIIRKIPELKRPRGNPGTKGKWYYKDIVCAFDIETSGVPFCDCAIMYLWQFQLGHIATIMGRTWQEFKYHCEQISKYLWSEQRLYIAVHNLSYEFQFLSGIYDFKKEEVFAVKPRKVLHCSMLFDKLQFYCSYLHSNMSLAEYTNKWNVDHVKLSGEEFNYNRVRFPWTELTDYEIRYGQHDVLGLVEAIEAEMKFDGDTLYSLPMTSTGYVRRDCKKAMRKSYFNVKNILPNLKTYKLCRDAFRGGDTHANRYYTAKHIKGAYSYDRSSSYPDVICNDEFPISEFRPVTNPTKETLLDYIIVKHKAVLVRIMFDRIKLIDRYNPDPYIPISKSRHIVNAEPDNGRILSADQLEITLTDIDFRIIMETYDWKGMQILEMESARYGKLPKEIIDLNIEYYERKTSLKNVDGMENYYMKSKNKLNSVYGMFAQDPCKQSIDYVTGEFIQHKDDLQELLTKYNEKAFLSYTWAPWVTARARYCLYEGIKLAGDGHLYNDTDSVKSNKPLDFTAYNKERICASKASGAYATDKHGVTHYMGVYEQEYNMSDFATLGAKKYCFIEEGSDKLHLTIAGVSKKIGAKELQRNGGIETFIDLEEPFTFYEGGGLEAIYDDNLGARKIEIDGHELLITKNVHLVPSTYTLGVKGEYARLLKGLNAI